MSRAKLEKVVNAPTAPTPKTVTLGPVHSDIRPRRNEPMALTISVPAARPAGRFHRRLASARASAPAAAAKANAIAVIMVLRPRVGRRHANGGGRRRSR